MELTCLVSSQVGNPNSTITRLQFSPRENLIAWTDSDGALSRWLKPISDNFPDPIKVSLVTTNAATVPVKRSDIDLFADDTTGGPAYEKDGAGDVDLDEDLIDVDDGWIVDDMDGAHKTEVPEGKRDPFVKEMGESTFHLV
jgi:chromosome transmission fidelity protein 4